MRCFCKVVQGAVVIGIQRINRPIALLVEFGLDKGV